MGFKYEVSVKLMHVELIWDDESWAALVLPRVGCRVGL